MPALELGGENRDAAGEVPDDIQNCSESTADALPPVAALSITPPELPVRFGRPGDAVLDGTRDGGRADGADSLLDAALRQDEMILPPLPMAPALTADDICAAGSDVLAATGEGGGIHSTWAGSSSRVRYREAAGAERADRGDSVGISAETRR